MKNKNDTFGICLKKPLNCMQANITTRIESYKGWTKTKPSPTALSEAGFYYTGCDDVVQCYYCGIKLRKWDVFDNPWIEHARHTKDCPHILNIKGETFYEHLKDDIENDGQNFSSLKRNLYTDDLIFTDAAKALLSLQCYKLEQIKEAIREFVSQHESLEFTAKDIAEIIWKPIIK